MRKVFQSKILMNGIRRPSHGQRPARQNRMVLTRQRTVKRFTPLARLDLPALIIPKPRKKGKGRTRRLGSGSMYFEKRFCSKHMLVHWMQVFGRGARTSILCHGEDFVPTDTLTHYVRRSGAGYEICPMITRLSVALEAIEGQSVMSTVTQDW